MSIAVTAEGRPLAFEVTVGGRRDSGTDPLTLNVWKTADLFFNRRALVKVNFWDATLAVPFLYVVVVVVAFVVL